MAYKSLMLKWSVVCYQNLLSKTHLNYPSWRSTFHSSSWSLHTSQYAEKLGFSVIYGFTSPILYLLLLFFFLRCHSSCKILVLWLGIELAPSVLKVQSANHWDCQEFFISTLSVFISPPFALSFLSDLEFCKVSLFCYKTSFLFKISQWKLYFGILPMVMISI